MGTYGASRLGCGIAALFLNWIALGVGPIPGAGVGKSTRLCVSVGMAAAVGAIAVGLGVAVALGKICVGFTRGCCVGFIGSGGFIGDGIALPVK